MSTHNMQAELIKTDGTVESLPDIELATLQKAVGGWIELIYTVNGDEMYINEEGKLQGLPLNIKATELFGSQNDVIVGNAIVIHREQMN